MPSLETPTTPTGVQLPPQEALSLTHLDRVSFVYAFPSTTLIFFSDALLLNLKTKGGTAVLRRVETPLGEMLPEFLS